MIHKIVPLKYEIKLWKGALGEALTKKYSSPEYLKNKLEEYFKLDEHKKDKKNICIHRIEQKDVALEEDVELDEMEGTPMVFIKFKYGDSIPKNDNGKVVFEGKVIQEQEDKGSLITDFYCGIQVIVEEGGKWLTISGAITLVKKSNEQMKAQITKLFEKEIYPQPTSDHSPQYKVEFKFEDTEVKEIKDNIKGLELLTEFQSKSDIDKAGAGKKQANTRVKISISGYDTDLKQKIQSALGKVGAIKDRTSERAVIKQGKSIFRSDFISDGLKLALKDSFLYSNDNISYEIFKQETHKNLNSSVEYDND